MKLRIERPAARLLAWAGAVAVIAGSSHATLDDLTFAAAPDDVTGADGRCRRWPATKPHVAASRTASQRRLQRDSAKPGALGNRWSRPAPRGEPIHVENGQPVLDRFGNVTGGVRSPFVDVPTSTWHGNSTGESFCRIAGHEVPFDAGRLRDRASRAS